jgi:hypothetical protein
MPSTRCQRFEYEVGSRARRAARLFGLRARDPRHGAVEGAAREIGAPTYRWVAMVFAAAASRTHPRRTLRNSIGA